MKSDAGHIRGDLKGLDVAILLDTGATKYSFISKDVANYMKTKGCEIEPVSIEGLLGNRTQRWRADYRIKIPLELHLQPYGIENKNVEIWALVFDELSFDVILGLPHLRELGLLPLLQQVLSNEEYNDEGLSAVTDVESDDEEPEIVQTINDVDDPDMVKIAVKGPSSLQAKLKALVQEYADLASNSIMDRKLLGVEDMKIDISHTVANKPRSPFRGHQRYHKDVLDEIERATQEMLAKGIIERSDGEFLQPVLLVSKKDGSLRFCIDFRFLNKITRVVNWPIPDIHVLIQRLQGYKYYGTLDLTSGYHQLVLDPSSRWLTSFMTSRGTWQFKRVPFGLKNAPAIFQRVMQEILGEYVGTICEIYIDDVIIFGRTEEEFAERVRLIFDRFRARGVIIKPSKCVLGASSIEYLGFRIDEHGYSLCEGRLEALTNLRMPTTATELRSFIGLVNCFRDFVPKLSLYLNHLTKLLHGKRGQQVLTWDVEANRAFHDVKAAALACQKLHFMRAEGEVFLYTDASDVGCGGALMQVIDGEQKPIAFVSKLFTEVQRKWPTNEKEMYGILYSIEKLHHLLALRSFTVKTDHRNLQFEDRMSASPKVERWKLRLQQYNYKTEYIEGEKNTVADALSRLCVMGLGMTRDDVKTLIEKYHNDIVGHHGARRTLVMMQKEGHRWYDQTFDVDQFVKTCPLCQRQGHGRKGTEGPQFSVQSTYRLAKYAADLVGPLPQDERRMNYILVVVDCFTKHVMLSPVETSGSLDTIEALERIFNSFGVPQTLLTDNGSTFASNQMAEFLRTWNISHDTSVPYNSQGNAICERMNREVRRHLDNLALQYENRPWSTLVSQVQRIVNSSPTGTGNLTPADMVLGFNAFDWPRTGMVGSDVLINRDDLQSKWATMLRERIIAVNSEQATQIQQLQDKKQEKVVDKNFKSYQPDDWIYVENNTRTKGDLRKAKMKGPVQVVSQVGRVVTYRDFITQAVTRVDVKDTQAFRSESGLDPRVEAARNVGEYIIDEIKGHRFEVGQRKVLKNVILKIKWRGYEEPTEETIGSNDSLLKNVKVREYMNQEPTLKKLIPRRFQ